MLYSIQYIYNIYIYIRWILKCVLRLQRCLPCLSGHRLELQITDGPLEGTFLTVGEAWSSDSGGSWEVGGEVEEL